MAATFREILPRKTALTIVTVIALCAILPFIPGRKLSGPTPQLVLALFTRNLAPSSNAKGISTSVKPAMGASAKASVNHGGPNVSGPYLTVPPGSLDTFFASLLRVERKEPGAITRILHYGDSPTTADSITADIRALLQVSFGDAGHGFLLIAKPWAWYGHHGVDLQAKGWRVEPASFNRARDGVHGLGGVSFRGAAGAWSRVRLKDNPQTRVIVYYWAQPAGGTFEVRAQDQLLSTVTTDSPDPHPGFAEVPLPAQTEEVEVRVTEGEIRCFGYRFDKPGPGVQYSSIGINGGQVQMAVRYFEVKQWSDALRHENPDLVVLNYGTNESIFPAYLDKHYPGELRTVIARLRAALPDASIMLMSPMDRGVKDESGEIATPAALTHLIEIQRQVAANTGCAFFNTFEAMGGAGTMARWYSMRPRLVSADFMHPLPAGAAKVGTLVEQALVDAYRNHGGGAQLAASETTSSGGTKAR
jgi:lysophospholipase L1-like esterase